MYLIGEITVIPQKLPQHNQLSALRWLARSSHALRLRMALHGGLIVASAFLLTGCISSRYRAAPKSTPPPVTPNRTFPAAPLEAGLTALILYNGPGSWKRNAFWDEYVLTLHNPGTQPVAVTATSLLGPMAAPLVPGENPWALEKASKTLEQRYRDAGIAFVRYTAPGVIIVTAGAAAVVGAGIFTPAAAAAATATTVAVPVYYLAVVIINRTNKAAMEKEFDRRRLILPLTLQPGETRTGSFFFPMVPAPRSLTLGWSSGPEHGEISLSLEFLRGLHVAAPNQPKDDQGH